MTGLPTQHIASTPPSPPNTDDRANTDNNHRSGHQTPSPSTQLKQPHSTHAGHTIAVTLPAIQPSTALQVRTHTAHPIDMHTVTMQSVRIQQVIAQPETPTSEAANETANQQASMNHSASDHSAINHTSTNHTTTDNTARRAIPTHQYFQAFESLAEGIKGLIKLQSLYQRSLMHRRLETLESAAEALKGFGSFYALYFAPNAQQIASNPVANTLLATRAISMGVKGWSKFVIICSGLATKPLSEQPTELTAAALKALLEGCRGFAMLNNSQIRLTPVQLLIALAACLMAHCFQSTKP